METSYHPHPNPCVYGQDEPERAVQVINIEKENKDAE